MRVALYARNSKPPKGWKPSFPGEEPPGSWRQQLEELRAWAAREGHEVALEAHDAKGSGWWAAEPPVGRVAHGIPPAMDELRGLGNAVCVPVGEFVGRRFRMMIESAGGVSQPKRFASLAKGGA